LVSFLAMWLPPFLGLIEKDLFRDDTLWIRKRVKDTLF